VDILNIIILSLIQGITEFLPISSSSHLILIPMLTEYPDQGVMFDIALHTGSLLAVIIYYRNEIINALKLSDHSNNLIRLLIIGSIPLPIAGLLIIDFVSYNLRAIEVIGLMTISFALLLLIADRKSKNNKDIAAISSIAILTIGLFQTLALVPGVSRSGIVITAALLLNYKRIDAIKIAFLLSIPAIFMASIYNVFEVTSSENIIIYKEHFIGMILSLLFSYITIHLFITTINKISFTPYIIYRILLGTMLLVF
jgi:undecaprenyl-diphosphatase